MNKYILLLITTVLLLPVVYGANNYTVWSAFNQQNSDTPANFGINTARGYADGINSTYILQGDQVVNISLVWEVVSAATLTETKICQRAVTQSYPGLGSAGDAECLAGTIVTVYFGAGNASRSGSAGGAGNISSEWFMYNLTKAKNHWIKTVYGTNNVFQVWEGTDPGRGFELSTQTTPTDIDAEATYTFEGNGNPRTGGLSFILVSNETAAPPVTPPFFNNITANYSNYTLLGVPIPTFDLGITANSINESLTCNVWFNRTGVSCGLATLSVNGTTAITTCTPTVLMESSVQSYVNCTKGARTLINYTFTMDTNSNPVIITNISTGYNNPFEVYIASLDLYGNLTCSIIFNNTNLTFVNKKTFDRCNQEFANLSPCNNTINGSYLEVAPWIGGTQVFDGLWNTYGTYNINPGVVYMNYSIPPLVTKDLITWKVSDGFGAINYLGIPNSCSGWTNMLELKVTSQTTTKGVLWHCKNLSQEWQLLRNDTVTDRVYEEEIDWIGNYTHTKQLLINYTSAGEYYVGSFGQCNSTSLYTYINSTTYPFWIDVVAPIITAQQFNGGNNSLHYFKNNITGRFIWTDSNLYSFNATVDTTQIAGVTGINSTTFTYNLHYNTSSLLPGLHNLTLRMADSHTASELSEGYRITKPIIADKIIIEKSEVDSITIRPDTEKALFNPMDYEVKDDRIKFSYEPPEPQEVYRFVVESKKPMQLIDRPDLQWKKWLITDTQWIDFVMDSEPNAKVDIELDKEGTTATISISNVKDPKLLQFDSVGDLNIVTLQYSFYTYNVTLEYQAEAVEGELQTSKLIAEFGTTPPASYWIDHWYNVSRTTVVTQVDGTKIYFNTTFYTPNVATTGNLTGRWSFNTTLENTTLYYSNKVYAITIDNCSGSNITAVNISFYTENYPLSPQNTTIEAEIYFWINPSVVENFTGTDSGRSNYKYCIYPENYTFSSNIYFKYLGDGGFWTRYYQYNLTINKTITQLIAYATNTTTGYSDLKGTTRDTYTYDYLTPVVVHLDRFYLSDGIWRTVQMDQSDVFGQIFFNVIEESIDYRMKFYDTQNHLLDITDRLKFICTAGVCDLTFMLAPYSSLYSTPPLLINHTYVNSTKMLYLSWLDTTNRTSTLRMIVTKETMASTVTICDNNITGSVGTTTCNLSLYTGNVLVRVLSSASPERSIVTFIIDIAKQKLSDLIGAKEGNLYSGAIIITVAMFGIFSPVGAVLSTLIGLIMVYSLGLGSWVTMVFVIIVGAFSLLIGLKVKT